MKKIIKNLLITSLVSVALVACGNTTENTNIALSNQQHTTQRTELENESVQPEELATQPEQHYEQYKTKRPNIHGMLSRVDYGDNTAYIIGSAHFGFPNWFPMADVVEQALQNADVFAFEVDLSSMEALMDMMYLQEQLMFLPDNMTLRQFLPEDIFEHFSYAIETYGLPYALVENMKPSAIASMTTVFTAQYLGMEFEYGIDAHIMDFAIQSELPIIGLHSIEDELAAIFDIPNEAEIDLARFFPTLQEAKEELLKVIEIYEAQNIDFFRNEWRNMISYDIEYNAHAQHIFDVIMTERSKQFGHKIARLLIETQEPTTFFITIGMNHVSGYTLETLVDMGFDVVGLYE